MNCQTLREFYDKQTDEAKEQGVLFPLHLKAYYKDVFAKHGVTFEKLGVDVNNGLGDVYKKMESLPEAQKEEVNVLQAELAALASEQAEMDKIRADQHAAYSQAKADLELGLSGVKQALT
eukprot:7361264-Heterocapsa_arctica.AAC.1